MELSIEEFHKDLYIPAIQKLAFHLPHVRILGTHHFGNTGQEEFRRHSDLQYVLCHRDDSKYALDRFVQIF